MVMMALVLVVVAGRRATARRERYSTDEVGIETGFPIGQLSAWDVDCAGEDWGGDGDGDAE
jgi:hypothetical protein